MNLYYKGIKIKCLYLSLTLAESNKYVISKL